MAEVLTYSKIFEKFFCTYSGPGVDWYFHVTDLLVYFLHEVYNKIHQFVFVHLLRMEVGYQKTDIVTL